MSKGGLQKGLRGLQQGDWGLHQGVRGLQKGWGFGDCSKGGVLGLKQGWGLGTAARVGFGTMPHGDYYTADSSNKVLLQLSGPIIWFLKRIKQFSCGIGNILFKFMDFKNRYLG